MQIKYLMDENLNPIYQIQLRRKEPDLLTLCALKRRRFYREFQSISLSYPSFRQGSLILGSCPDFVCPKGRNHI
jgi:hypothetical protein